MPLPKPPARALVPVTAGPAQPVPGARSRDAIALTYEAAGGAPRVVAKGKGLVAERIIETAREHGVFVHESRELVALLMNVDLDDEIPPALYRAIAELLAWLYRLESDTMPQPRHGGPGTPALLTYDSHAPADPARLPAPE